MSEEEILEGNRLIAEFMGAHKKGDAYKFKGDKYIPEKELLFHCSWEWIMRVGKKINTPEFFVRVPAPRDADTLLPCMKAMEKLKTGAIRFDLQMTWEGVVKYIKWYNQNKK